MLLIGVVLGVAVGVAVGAAVFFVNRRPIDLGVVSPREEATPAVAVGAGDKEVFAAYAGSASCRDCHAKEYDLWAKSHHGLAERAADPALDKAAFEPPRSFDHGTQRTEVRASGDKFAVVTPGLDGKPVAHPVERVIGVSPLRQFLTPFPGGNRLQTLEASYDPHKNEWFNVYGDEDRRPGEWGHWTGRGMNWNSQCASCHNTRVRKNYDERTDSYHTSMAQLTVSCESCHGPMKAHADAYRAGTTPPPVKRLTKDQTFDTCGSCHARRSELTDDFVPGDAFHDRYSLSITDLTDTFHPDGQVRDEDYEFSAFLGSKMHAAGVRCADCHEPHSGKRLFEGNNLCMRCHNGSHQGSPVIVPEQHSFHKVDSAGNQCVNCHMPQTTFMQRHGRHDHGFTVPDPVLTKEHGIPNACNRCHTDKDAAWLIAAVDRWYGARMNRPSRERAREVARSRRGDEGARPAVVRMLREEKQPYWQAVAAAVLGQWAASPDVLPALLEALGHASPIVRENAARALQPLADARHEGVRTALTKLLADPARSVRIRAAWALRDAVEPNSAVGRELLASLAQSADQPTGAAQLGTYHLSRGDLGRAVGYFAKAVQWDPNSAPLRDSLAVGFSLQGKTREAVEQLTHAMQLDPRDAEYPYKLALAYNELNQPDRTIAFLEEALRLDPRHARAAYNLGLAHDRAGRAEQAVEALRRAEGLNPNDPDAPYARATIHAKLRQLPQAREAAARALQIDSQYRPAIELLQMLR
jgi:tetratricopeptide (TPR) repeat protein